MRVSIVVITARDDPGFLSLAQSVQKSTHKDVELVLVDRLKASRGDSWSQACEQAKIPFVHVQDSPIAGPCPSSARNLGISVSSGEIIICLDDLTTFDQNFVSNHVARFGLGFDSIVGSYVEEREGQRFVDPRTTDVRQDSGLWIANRYYGMHMAFTKSSWQAVGGFDEAFDGAYGYEDCDFGRRLFRAGFAIGWFPELTVLCIKDQRHHLNTLRVGVAYKGTEYERTFSDEPQTLMYGSLKWKNDKLIALNDELKTLDGGHRYEE